MSKRRNGFPSETHVERGRRFIKGGEIELTEKTGPQRSLPLRFRTQISGTAASRPAAMTAPSARTTFR